MEFGISTTKSLLAKRTKMGHTLLLVGDGDFSFSLSLAKGFGSASNIVASSLDTYDEVINKYKNAKSNLEELQKLGASLLHGVDATKMKFYPDLKMRRFDRIIYNFPHAGFHGKEDDMKMIKMHMDLVFGFFKNASHLLRAYGEIHVNHKTTPPFNNWNLEKLAKQSFLAMIECVDFNKEDYPDYNNKRGDSFRCDDPFPLGKCSTFKFINDPRSLKNHLRRNHMEVSGQQITNLPFQEIHNIEIFPAPVDLNYHPRTMLPIREIQNMKQLPAPVGLNYHPPTRPPVQEIQNMKIFSAPLDLNYHPRTRLPLREIQNMRQFPAPVDLNYHLQKSLFPNTNQLDYFPPTSHFPKMNEPMRSEFDLRNYINGGTEIHGRVASSADRYHYARYMTQDIQRYSLTEPLRRPMDIIPPISLGARNEGGQYQPVERSSHFFDVARHELERYNAEVPRKVLNREIYVIE